MKHGRLTEKVSCNEIQTIQKRRSEVVSLVDSVLKELNYGGEMGAKVEVCDAIAEKLGWKWDRKSAHYDNERR